MKDFERAIKQDIRNNPIVREVDLARQRELWRSVGVSVFLVVVLLFSSWQHFELLRHGYQIEQLQRARTQELEINRHLRLEIETLRSPKRIERIATQQLNLIEPTNEDALVVERIMPTEPSSELMAARNGETRAIAEDVDIQP